MIGVEQWRASIGLYHPCSHRQRFQIPGERQLAPTHFYHLIMIILLALILAKLLVCCALIVIWIWINSYSLLKGGLTHIMGSKKRTTQLLASMWLNGLAISEAISGCLERSIRALAILLLMAGDVEQNPGPLPPASASPESRALHYHSASLITAIADPLRLLWKLYAAGIIEKAIKDKVQLQTYSKEKKNRVLLSAVMSRVDTDPNLFHKFVYILKNDGDGVLKSLGGKLEDTYDIVDRSGVSILVCGRTGVGKSSLVNFILGKDVCKVNDPVDVYDRQTSAEITSVEASMNGVLVTIYESSALQDGTADERTLDDLYSECRDVDLIIYCQEMTTVRMQPSEVECLRLITAKFGNPFWRKTVLVLTKANFVRPRRYDNDEDVIEYFRSVALTLERTIQSEVNKHVNQLVEPTPAAVSSMNEGTITLTAVPAGSARDPILPGGKHFIGNLYISCLERLPQLKVQRFGRAMHFVNRFVSCKNLKPVDSPAEPSYLRSVEEKVQYPIYVDEKESERLKLLKIEVPCDFRYAGCKVALPLKNMADHMKEDSVTHTSMLASYFQQQLRRVADENAQLRKEVTDLRKQLDQLF